MPKKSLPLPSKKELDAIWRYEPHTGEFFWKISPSYRIKAGSMAGAITSYGYVAITYNGTLYKAHRLAWRIFHGEDPGTQEVDHINRIRSDNRIKNLRLATRQQQSFNTKTRTDNKTGRKGVEFRAKYLEKPYYAIATEKGKKIILGTFSSFEEALVVREEYEQRKHGEFGSF
jgi:hypothetical protein